MTYPFSVHSDEFKDKRVLLTGGTKGMGAAMVERFRISGARIATTARSEPAGFKQDVLFQLDGCRHFLPGAASGRPPFWR